MITITLNVKQYTDLDSVVHIDIAQTYAGGLAGTAEARHLNGVTGEHEDTFFGKLRGRSRYVRLAEVEDEYLKAGWLDEGGEFIETYVESVGDGWTATQIWGFAELGGKRYYVRRTCTAKGGKSKRARLVYDYVGK